MATYAGALTVAAAAYAYAKRHVSNRRFSFGTGKVGDLAGFASALILGVVALGIAFESVQRLMDPRRVAFGQATVVAVVGLAGRQRGLRKNSRPAGTHRPRLLSQHS